VGFLTRSNNDSTCDYIGLGNDNPVLLTDSPECTTSDLGMERIWSAGLGGNPLVSVIRCSLAQPRRGGAGFGGGGTTANVE